MKIKWLVYLATLITATVAIEYKGKIRSVGALKIINTDSDDSELMQLEASGSKSKQKDKTEQQKVKTLSQQVADGKYGLIQKELFNKPPKRPGVLSYDFNSEVPNDTINNLGGLDKNEIWLAESHLLVLKGGSFPPYENKHEESLWPPLDTYKAPLHQVKIPSKPKVPPPFPVQLTEDGPLQILGTNFSRTLNETDQSKTHTLPSKEGNAGGEKISAGNSNPSNTASGTAPMPIPVINPGEFSPGVSFPPSNLNETWPPFLTYLPPGAIILPPPGNETDLYDDDDPSIYYPPPYSFYFPQDNSSKVPPGPLVPGIILPPPPNFFALLEEEKPMTTSSTPRIPSQRYRKPTTPKSNIDVPTIPRLPATTKVQEITTEKAIRVYPVQDDKTPVKISTDKPAHITGIQNQTYLLPKTIKPHFIRKNPPNRTILRPVKTKTTSPPRANQLSNNITHKPLNVKNTIISTTQVPLKYYYDTNSNFDNQPATKLNTKVNKTTLEPVQYYYYEEKEKKVVTTTKPPVPQHHHYGATEGLYIPPKPSLPPRQRRPQYIYVTGKPYNTQKPRFRFIQQPVRPDTFGIHIAKIQNQIHQYYTTTKTTKKPTSRPVYQYSFEAANYQSQHDFKPSEPDSHYEEQFKSVPAFPPKYSVQVQQAVQIFPTESTDYRNEQQEVTNGPNNYYTTSRPDYDQVRVNQNPAYFHPITTARPILEYSFEVTQNPIHQGYYTKPDESFFDDNTRQYFTVFGKKLTTPLPHYKPRVPEPYYSDSDQSLIYQKGRKYNQRPILIESDAIVNYVHPRPYLNSENENGHDGNNYPNIVRYPPNSAQYNNRQKSNRKEPEIVKAIEVPVQAKESQDGSYISYQLPGEDGSQFYFLTPQSKEQGSRFYYSQSNSKRIRRNDLNSDKDR